jgi:hypothetical protein
MTFVRSLATRVAATLLILACGGARADGLADLRAALARLPGTTPLKATLEARDWRRTGEGKELEEHQGAVSIGLEDGPRGLVPVYGRDLLARADAEQRVAVKDKKAAKPIEQTLGQLGVAELHAIASAAPALAREIDEATFRSESDDTLDGKAARRLVFETGIDSLPEKDRKYAKEFKSVLTVWIGADGAPLACSRRLDVAGSAFVVIKFEMHDEQARSFAVVGDRLVALRDDQKGSAKGAGENTDYRTERRLQVLP